MTLGLAPLPGTPLVGDTFDLQCAIIQLLERNVAYCTTSLMQQHVEFGVKWSRDNWRYDQSLTILRDNGETSTFTLPVGTALLDALLPKHLSVLDPSTARARVGTFTFGVWEFYAHAA